MSQLDEEVRIQSARVRELIDEIEKVLVGQRGLIQRLLLGLLTGGHVLLEGVPGLAKTLAIRTLAQTVCTGFARIQFTPDMLPADIIGTEVFQPRDGSYTVKKGPIFNNLILADEINRAPAKVQAALLEAMQERQVTIGDQTFKLQEPFLVLATQNPIEQEGTYPLPEAQIDRFCLKALVGYPSREEERRILDRFAGSQPPAQPRAVLKPEELLRARETCRPIFIDDKVKDYIVHLVQATRDPAAAGLADLAPLIENGASPRATLALAQLAKAQAFLDGRAYVTPHDVKAIAPDVLRHRLLCSYEAEAQDLSADAVVARILERLEVP